jgi:Transposase DDE domain group 1
VSSVSRGLDRIRVTFDEPTLVANAGLLLIATLAARLGVERLVNDTVRLGGRVGGAQPGRKVLTLVHAILAGASHIDHANVLRAGQTSAVLGHKVMAPSTLGTFLRAFTFGHVRQLEAVTAELLRRAWAMGAGPTSRLVVDVDSTICEVAGARKHGASFGYTKVRGYHPLLATRSDTGEVLHARLRKGSANSARGMRRFIEELVPRLRRAGASGEIVLRMDSGFWSNDTMKLLGRLKVRFTMAVRTGNDAVAKAIAGIEEGSWTGIDYVEDGVAEVAETIYKGRRLIVRRTRLIGPDQKLWPDWRHFAFLTDLDGEAVELDAFHRDHARVELAIRDLKEGAGMEHVPSGQFFANAAWLCCAVLAHDLARWAVLLGGVAKLGVGTVARTVRTQLLALPARLVNRSGEKTLRLPKEWPWQSAFDSALEKLRAIPASSG